GARAVRLRQRPPARRGGPVRGAGTRRVKRAVTVVATGLGAVCGLGSSVDEVWRTVLGGRSAIRPLALFPTASHRTALAAEVPADADLGGDASLPRAERFACAAAAAAVRALPAATLRG